MTVTTVLIIVAVVLWVLAALNVPCPLSLGWLGMAFYGVSLLVGRL